ncbi:MAG: acyltransferase family protein [Candidatus Helarchaeota archaeon]
MKNDINTSNLEANKNIKTKKRMDWRIEFARIPAIIVVVVVHMQLDTGWIESNTMPQNFLLYVAMAVFMFASGFVQGLKDEFNKEGSISKKYSKYVKKRFIRLYSGYYLALGSVFLSRLFAYYIISRPFPCEFNAWTIFLDLTGTWGVFTQTGCGGIWPPGWFIGAIFIISLLYPFLRRLSSINKMYIYIIMIITVIARIIVAFTLYNPAYFFPLVWLTEFCLGMLIGDWSRRTGGPPEVNKSYQRGIIKLGRRVWPLYLCHIVPIVWMSMYADLWEFIVVFIICLSLTELYHRILNFITPRLVKKIL